MEEKIRIKVARTICHFMEEANMAGLDEEERQVHVQEVGAAVAIIRDLGVGISYMITNHWGVDMYESVTIDGYIYAVRVDDED